MHTRSEGPDSAEKHNISVLHDHFAIVGSNVVNRALKFFANLERKHMREVHRFVESNAHKIKPVPLSFIGTLLILKRDLLFGVMRVGSWSTD